MHVKQLRFRLSAWHHIRSALFAAEMATSGTGLFVRCHVTLI